MDEDARTGGADLALVHEGPQHDALGGGVHIGVGIDDLRILAAQLKRDFLQAPGGVRHDDPARRGRSGQRNLADIGMGDQRLAGGLARAADDVDDTGRQDVADRRGQFQSRERRRLRRLVDHRVADRDGRRDLAGEHVERKIPRPHDADDAERLPEIHAQDMLADRQGVALEGAHGPGEIAEPVGRRVDVGDALAPWFAGVGRLEPGEALDLLDQPVGNLQHQVGALAGAHPGPFPARALGGQNGRRYVDLVGVGYRTQQLAGER